MTNYEAVRQWTATLNADKAYNEISELKKKYPWLKCDESFKLIAKMYTDLPKIANIIKLQEKQNAIHEKYIEVNQLADAAIVTAIASQYNIEL
jgi:hypothetical protein